MENILEIPTLYSAKIQYPIKRNYSVLSLILFEINKTISDIPNTMTTANMNLDDVMNADILSVTAFEVPIIKPHIWKNNDKPMLFPTSLLVDRIVDASDKSFWSTIVITKR